ncbi:hypothetical protein MLD38_032480 [Melastoma candidum]|uniref:Uncharacterized protein n=1 Tax=Melastoma candidum TaxID=119954 RepID=A0ACB9M4C6_9MYRT|nr:hypothetical protein MLD38_032480 [Melastoma candidum]
MFMDPKFPYFSPKKTDQIRTKHTLYFLVLLLLLSSFVAFYFICPPETLSFLRFAYIAVPQTTSSPHQFLRSPSTPISDKECDYTRGIWVRDVDNGKFQYYDEGCPFLDPGFQCLRNGREDEGYLRWRWQPHGCQLPRFNATDLLERSRNGRIVFAGDSIGRNQWESFLCMVSRSVSNLSNIYEVHGNPISKHKGYLSMMFADYNLTVEYYRSPFLVASARAPPNSPAHVRGSVLVDEMHVYSRFWSGADVLVCNAGHWWNQDKTDKMGFYFQEKGALNMSMDVVEGFGRAMKTWRRWASEKIERNNSHVFFRSYSPAHFRRQGAWNEGGHCNDSTEPFSDPSSIRPDPFYNDHISKAIRDMERRGNRTKVHFLNITGLTEYRRDGHPSSHREPGTPKNASQDCSHWCLPGIPDTWNKILYATLIRDGYRVDRGG